MSLVDWIIAGVLALFSLVLIHHTLKVARFYEEIGGIRWVPMAGAIAVIVGFALAFTSEPWMLYLAIALLIGGFVTYVVGGFLRRGAVRRRRNQGKATHEAQAS